MKTKSYESINMAIDGLLVRMVQIENDLKINHPATDQICVEYHRLHKKLLMYNEALSRLFT